MLCTCMLGFKSPNIYRLWNEQNNFLAVLLEGGGMHSAWQFEALHDVAKLSSRLLMSHFYPLQLDSLWSVSARVKMELASYG